MAEAKELSFSEQGEVLQTYSKALKREFHVLKKQPDILWQQMYNRLQWEKGPMADIVSAERGVRSQLGNKTWLRLITHLQESSSLQRVITDHTHPVNACTYSSDGIMLASGSNLGIIRLWNTQTGNEIAVLNVYLPVNSCAFSPDNRILAYTHYHSVRLWDVHSRENVAVLNNHTDEVLFCIFSPDGLHLASTSNDKTVRL
jgi:WD40 repeat protein